MQLALVILSALAPVIVLLCYIFHKDSAHPEPAKWLIKAFFYGIASAFLAMLFGLVITFATGLELDVSQHTSILGAFIDAFSLAAIPEEVAKFIMLWLLLRKNPFFDEHFDGIVYAVSVGMGFAGFENVLYLLESMESGSWIGTGIMRALFSVPGHFLFAVFMGYYYSLYHFKIDRSFSGMLLVLLAPILAHGLFDGILFCSDINGLFSLICMILFLVLFNKLRKLGRDRIFRLLNK